MLDADRSLEPEFEKYLELAESVRFLRIVGSSAGLAWNTEALRTEGRLGRAE